MSDETAVRQGYYNATTGKGMKPAPNGSPNPGFKKGGRVHKGGFKKGAQNMAGSHGHSFQVAGKKAGDNC